LWNWAKTELLDREVLMKTKCLFGELLLSCVCMPV